MREEARMSEIRMAVMDAQDKNFFEPSPDKGARFVNFSACGSGRVGEKESVVEPTWIPKFLGMQETGIYLEDSYLKYCIQEENAKNTPSGSTPHFSTGPICPHARANSSPSSALKRHRLKAQSSFPRWKGYQ
jgi:hypothetical protein